MKRFTLFLIGFIVLAISAGAQNLRGFSYPDSWGPQGFSLDESRSDAVYVNYSIKKFSLTDNDIKGELMTNVLMPGAFLPGDEGMPDLPGSGKFIAIPTGAQVEVNILSSRTETIQNIDIAPSPRIPLDTDNGPLFYEKDQKVYSKNAYYPAKPVQVGMRTKIRGVEVVMLGITPWQYNPVTKELIVYHDLKVELSITGGNGYGDLRYRSPWWEDVLKSSVLNYESLPEAGYAYRDGSGTRTPDLDYIIITPDDPVFTAWADTIALFRNKQGIKTGVVTTAEIGGNTTTAIENYINNAYNTWDVPPSAVLLIGDYGSSGNTIVSPIWNSYCVSDNIYADVDNDKLPDITFARMTAQNATHLETMVTKFKNYEMDPPTDPDFYDHPITALGWQTERWFQICSESVGGFWSNELGKDPVRINAIYSGSPGSTWSTATNTSTVVNYFGPNGTGYIPQEPSTLGGWTGGTASGVNNAINSGAFMLQHRDHGWEQGWGEPDYSSSDINGLTNTDLTFVFSINCLTGKYNYSSEVFAEKFHRYTYNGQNSGALGIIAASEVSYSFVNDTYVWGMYDDMWSEFLPDYGTTNAYDDVRPAFANVYGKHYLAQSNWPYNTNNKEVTYMLFHHHGDAYSTVFTQVPLNLTVTHNGVLLSGVTQYEVTADEYATICLSKNGEILDVEQSNGTPTTLTFPAQLPGDVIDLVVTKQDHYRYEQQITVIPPSGPYVIKDSHTLDDATGNANGNPEPGETVGLSLTMKNVGSGASNNTVVDITTTDSYITITDDTENYGTINAGQTKLINNGYTFDVADSIPDGHMVTVSISSTNGTDVWNSSLAFELFAPQLEAGSITIDDAAGNGNGRLDPGETASVIVATTNNGQSSAAGVMATLTTTSTDITITNGSANLGELTPGESDNATFEITVAPDATIGSTADFTYEVASGVHYTDTKDFTLTVGLIVEDFESGDFSQYNWSSGGDAPWQVVTNPVYEGVYSAASGDISDNQESELIITLDVIMDDSISFWHKISSENNYDKLQFYMDGNILGTWSGMLNWAKAQYPVSAGTHIFKWAYEKDYSMSSGDDAAYLDFIILPAFGTPSANAGSDAEVCEATGHTLSGIASNYNSILWETSGNGTFDDAASLTATYTPGTADAAAGFATLTLNAIGGAATATDDMVLTVNPLPTSPGQPSGDEVVCDQTQDNDYTCPQLADPGITSYVWEITPATAGTISSTDTAATVNWTDTFSGLAYIKVKAENACGYGDYSDELEVSVNETPTQAGTPSGSQAVCQGTNGTEYTTTGANNATDYTWALNPTDAGTITPNGTTATIEWSQTYNGTAGLTVTGTNACGDGPASTALSISVDILPEPAITGSDAACQNDTLVYSTPSNAGCSYSWTIAGGTIVDGSGTNEVSVVWDSWGGCELMVTETNDNSGCEGTTDPFVVAVEESPAPEITGTEVVCEQEEGAIYATTDNTGNTYNWTVSGGTIESGQGTHEITVNWGAYGTGTVELTETNANACHGYAETFDVEIMEIPEAEAGDDVSIPNGTSTRLYGSATGGSGSYGFHWEPADKLLDPNVAEPQTTELDATTIFTLEVSDNTGGCAGTDQVTVTVTGGALAVTVTADDAAVCPGSTTTLHAIPGGGSGEYTYAWTSDPAGFTSEEQNPEVSPEVNTTYFVEVNDGYNSISGEVSVSVHALPEQFEITGEDSFCEGSAGAVLGLSSSESDVTYKLFLDGTNTGTTAEGTGSAITFAPQATEGTYTVMAESQATGCLNDMGNEFVVTMEFAPVKPEMPAGPELVDLNISTISTYSVAEVAGADSYNWSLEPSGFGELDVSGNEVTVNWNGLELGEVSLSVAAVNDCGESSLSDAITIEVDRLYNIEDNDNVSLNVYPNPSKGVFTLEYANLPSDKLNIKIISSLGECVYQSNEATDDNGLINLDLSNYADGVYFLMIQHDGAVHTKRILVRK